MYDLRVIQGCPCNALLAPYIALLAQETGASVNSIYRGEDAAEILRAHAKSTQAELFAALPGIANPPGRSTHELRCDGVTYPIPVGAELRWWQQGFDVNDADVEPMLDAARAHGWELFQPYASDVEYHHLNMRTQPRPQTLREHLRLVRLRNQLPRR